MLNTSGSTKFKTRPSKSKVEVCGSRAGRGRNKLDGSRNDNNEVDGNKVEDDEVRTKVQKSSKSKNLSKSKKTVELDFLTPGAKLVFTKLRQAFFKAPIFHHFDPEYHIRIEMDASGYAISGVFSQLTSNDLGRWHLVAFFLQKMILAETRYKTYNSELLAIIKAFKTLRHYLEGSRHKVLVLTDYKNLRQFMDTKSLSFRQVR